MKKGIAAPQLNRGIGVARFTKVLIPGAGIGIIGYTVACIALSQGISFKVLLKSR
jgi:hypothetical protein